jgi:hypothetical protein
MRVDCERCTVRGPAACGDCVVTVLLGAPPEGIVLDAAEQQALQALAGAGLVPPLRLVTGDEAVAIARQPPAAGPRGRGAAAG